MWVSAVREQSGVTQHRRGLHQGSWRLLEATVCSAVVWAFLSAEQGLGVPASSLLKLDTRVDS